MAGVSGRSDDVARCRSCRRAPARDYGTAFGAGGTAMAPSRCAGFISRRFVPVGRAAVPFDPVRVVEAMLGVVDAGTPKEFDQAVVVVDEADHLSVYGDHPTTGRCGVVHDYRGAHPSRVHQAPDRSILSSGLPSPVLPTGILFRLAKTIQVLLPPGLRHCKRLTVTGRRSRPLRGRGRDRLSVRPVFRHAVGRPTAGAASREHPRCGTTPVGNRVQASADGTIRENVDHLDRLRAWLGRPLWDVERGACPAAGAAPSSDRSETRSTRSPH